jgi:hypothetical protein
MGQVTAVEQCEGGAFFYVVPRANFHLDDAAACRSKDVHHAGGVGFDVRGQLQIIGDGGLADGNGLNAFGVGSDVFAVSGGGRIGTGWRRSRSVGVRAATAAGQR